MTVVSRPKRRRAWTWRICAVAFIAIVVVQLFIDWGILLSGNITETGSGSGDTTVAIADFGLRRLPDYDPYLAAPILSPSRQPIDLPNLVGPAPANDGSESIPYELVGIIISQGTPVGIIKQLNDDTTLRIIVGDKIRDWVVTDIDVSFIVLERSGRTVSLHLSEDNDAGPGN